MLLCYDPTHGIVTEKGCSEVLMLIKSRDGNKVYCRPSLMR